MDSGTSNDIRYSAKRYFALESEGLLAPDVAVLRGYLEDYETSHPTTALLVVEVSDSTLIQDRLTKSHIYAAAGVNNYWIVNLRDGVVEWFGEPDALARGYRSRGIARRDDDLKLAAFPSAEIRAAEFFPPV